MNLRILLLVLLSTLVYSQERLPATTRPPTTESTATEDGDSSRTRDSKSRNDTADQGSGGSGESDMATTDPTNERTGMSRSDRRDDLTRNDTADLGSGVTTTDPTNERTGMSRSDRRDDSTRNDTADLGSSVTTTDPTNERTGMSRSDSRSNSTTSGTPDPWIDMAITDPTNERTGKSRSGSRRRNDMTDQESGMVVTDPTNERTGMSRSDTRRNDTDEGSSRCMRVTVLLSQGCIRRCLVEDSDGCPSCNLTCHGLLSSAPSVDEMPCNCTDNQVCLRVGRFGERKCVDLLSEGERCNRGRKDNDDDDDDDDDVKLNEATIGCQEGLVCTPVKPKRSECQPINPDGPCVVANQGGADHDCAPDGSFEPLQCELGAENLLSCVCVNPGDGTPIDNTEVTVSSKDEAPECDQLVGCTVVRGDQTFDVDHGDYFVDVDNCQRCLCNNGEATLCEPSVCTALQQDPEGCEPDYKHGDTFQIGCNMCGCRSGEISCTQQQCEGSEVGGICQECMSVPVEQVCGINGLTYPSSCVATSCAGLTPSDVVQGSCSDVDTCALYPCANGEICIRKGGVACIDADGCDPDDLRVCISPDSLLCEDDDDDDDDNDDDKDNSTAVCATNGVTYPSLCRLIQDTGNEAVAHAGPCDREDCEGGPVCGTDGVTYDNVCTLRTLSANARVDFYGACPTGPGSNNFCETVSTSGRCAYNSLNCNFLVEPEEGCCPLCGGVIFIAVDFAGLRDYIRINPTLRTLDDFIEILMDSGFIDDEVTDRCELEGSLTTSGNIQITLSAEDDEDTKFCNDASQKIAASINNLSSVSATTRIPEVLQFASAAVAAPNTAAGAIVVERENSGMNGAPILTALRSSYFALLLLLGILTFVLV